MKDASTFDRAVLFALEVDLSEPNPLMLIVEEYLGVLSDEQLEVVVAIARQRLADEQIDNTTSTTVEELRTLEQFVCWRREPDPSNPAKPKKVPRMARDLRRRASSTDPSTWCEYQTAKTVVDAGKADGVGFAITADDNLVLVDLDDCRDGDGKLHPSARAIVRQLDTYWERSQSGDGLHALAHGKIPAGYMNQTTAAWGGKLEAWDHDRFLYLTGDVVVDRPIMPRQAELDLVFAEHVPKRAVAAPALPTVPVSLDDRELIDKAFAAKNGADFQALWNGHWEGRYLSQSEADLALCGMLSFWTGRDPDRIDRLFRSSGLYRPKWDRDDYRENTIAEAINGCNDIYEPRA